MKIKEILVILVLLQHQTWAHVVFEEIGEMAGALSYVHVTLMLDLHEIEDQLNLYEKALKRLNDTIGHYAGDATLVAVSERLTGLVRPGDTLARLGAQAAGVEGLESILIGPAAITFAKGDIAATAKALRDASKTMPLLVIKGGAMSGSVLSAKNVEALADLPSRETLLSMIAGAFQAPLVKTAGLLQALPRNFAYGLKALIDQKEAA